MTTGTALSRRNLIAAAGLGTLSAACAGVSTRASGEPAREQLIRSWYAAWVTSKSWDAADALLIRDFNFSSAAGDDHISKSTFKKQCWDTQIAFIAQFEIESMFENADEAFVKYLCRTRNGKSFRNVERFTFRDGRIASIECYFGQESSFPSAVSKG